MTVTGTQARYELTSSANASAVNTSGGFQLGTSLTSVVYTDSPDSAYSLAMLIQSGVTLTMDMSTGAVTGTVAGTNQVKTATIVAASGATTAGDLNVTVTSALVTGSPLLIPVALLLSDNTAALVAAKVRAALTANAAVAAHYTVGGSSATYSLTSIEKAANDATLNMAHANGTCAGITTAATATSTTAGVGTSRAYKFSGETWNNTDPEGRTLPTMTKLHSMLIRTASTSGTLEISDGTDTMTHAAPFVNLSASPAGAHTFTGATVTFAASVAPMVIYIDVHAGE
jgi:hypothetical protein